MPTLTDRQADRTIAETELRRRLRALFDARAGGASRAVLDRVRADADGFADALVRERGFSEREILRVVTEERAHAAGPATCRVGFDGVERGSA